MYQAATREVETGEVQRVHHSPKKRMGRPPFKSKPKKKKPMKITQRFLDTRPHVQTPQATIHRRGANKLGMFKVGEIASKNEIEKAIRDCGKGTDNSLVIHQYLIRAFDENITKAAVVSFLLYMEAHLGDENKVFVTKYPEIIKFTGVKRLAVYKIMKELKDEGIVEAWLKGIPPKQHYKVDHEMLKQLIIERIITYKDPLFESGAVNIV